MRVQELAPGLWRWTGLHPDWTERADWGREVGCVYYEGSEAIVLIDPLVPPEAPARFWTALDRDVERAGLPVVTLLTVPWHERSATELEARYAATRGTPTACVEPLTFGGAGGEPETLYWLAGEGALVAGDLLLGNGGGVRLCPESWLPKGVGHDRLREELRPLLELPVERLLVAHGEPVLEGARAALAQALAPAPRAA